MEAATNKELIEYIIAVRHARVKRYKTRGHCVHAPAKKDTFTRKQEKKS